MARDAMLDEIRSGLEDWIDGDDSDRKILARRQANRPMQANEMEAMRAAFDLLLEGRIAIHAKSRPTAFGRGTIITFIAERLK